MRALCVCALACMSFASSPTASAAIVGFTFTGSVTSVPASLASEFSVGEAIAGSYQFESTSIPVGSSYFASVTGFSVNIGGDYSLTANGLGDIDVQDGAVDSYIVASFSVGSAVGAATPTLHAIQLTDPTGTAISGTGLPLTPPNVGNFASRLFTLDYSNGSRLVGQIDTISAVPEPAGFALATIAVVGLFSRRRRFAGRIQL
ncbi:MAG: PEP-CTERM sorting domain-containing protein [Planctomycetales bacterium]|nr:PEP-CTERM sorting domain-containing protein [Planctomycetales bacterium]